MEFVEITDPDDVRVAAYRNIRERDLVGRGGRFVAEGKVLLRVLLGSAYRIESALVLKRRLPGLEDMLDPALGAPVYVVEDEVMEAIAGFAVHRGILAIGRRGEESDWRRMADAFPSLATVVVCVGVSNHDNIGSIFRNAAAFGAAAVILDATCCDPFYRKALRVSVGGVLKTPFARADDMQEVASVLDERGFRQFALTPGDAMDIASVEAAGRTAIYLGSEGEGLPDAIMSRMTRVRIPISSQFDSLNVAAASAIALHRLTSATRVPS